MQPQPGQQPSGQAAASLASVIQQYESLLAKAELPAELDQLRRLDEAMRIAVEQGIAAASSEPGQAGTIQAHIALLADLNQQLLARVEQGRREVAAQLGDLGEARKGARAYAEGARL